MMFIDNPSIYSMITGGGGNINWLCSCSRAAKDPSGKAFVWKSK
jgi:hypothetical protein